MKMQRKSNKAKKIIEQKPEILKGNLFLVGLEKIAKKHLVKKD